MSLQLDIQGRVLIAAPEGELDHHKAERLRVQIDSAYEKSPCRHMILDMSAVSFMDSSGIGMIIGRYKNAEKRGGQLALARLNPNLSKLFELSGLAKIVLRTQTVEAALESLGGYSHD